VGAEREGVLILRRGVSFSKEMDQQSFGGGFLVSTLTTTVVLVNSILSFLLSELYFWRIPRPEGRGCPVVQDVIRLYELGGECPAKSGA